MFAIAALTVLGILGFDLAPVLASTAVLLPGRPAIVESILALARTLNTSVVAEGIESEVQARELERLGCTHAQGFLFSRPLSTQSAEGVVTASRPLGPKGVIQTSSPALVSAAIA